MGAAVQVARGNVLRVISDPGAHWAVVVSGPEAHAPLLVLLLDDTRPYWHRAAHFVIAVAGGHGAPPQARVVAANGVGGGVVGQSLIGWIMLTLRRLRALQLRRHHALQLRRLRSHPFNPNAQIQESTIFPDVQKSISPTSGITQLVQKPRFKNQLCNLNDSILR